MAHDAISLSNAVNREPVKQVPFKMQESIDSERDGGIEKYGGKKAINSASPLRKVIMDTEDSDEGVRDGGLEEMRGSEGDEDAENR